MNENIASLDLKKNSIGDEGVKILMKAIQNSKQVVNLDLSSNMITYKGAKKIFKALTYNVSVISLKLASIDGTNKNKIGSKGAQYLINYLQTSEYLQFLDLRSNLLCDNGILCVADALANNKILISLNIACNDITAFGVDKLKDSLLTSNLKELDISSNPLGNSGIDHLAKYLSHQDCSLKKLNVKECKYHWQANQNLFYSFKKNASLNAIIADRNDISNLRVMRYFAETIQGTLQYISLAGCSIGEEGGVYIGEGLGRTKWLKTLILKKNELRDETVKEIAEALQKSNVKLQYLDLSSNLINDAGGNLLA